MARGDKVIEKTKLLLVDVTNLAAFASLIHNFGCSCIIVMRSTKWVGEYFNYKWGN
jgi:hypothetical protein